MTAMFSDSNSDNHRHHSHCIHGDRSYALTLISFFLSVSLSLSLSLSHTHTHTHTETNTLYFSHNLCHPSLSFSLSHTPSPSSHTYGPCRVIMRCMRVAGW